MIGASMLLLQAVGALAADQTRDIVLAGRFLEAVRTGDQAAMKKIGPEAQITAYESSTPLSGRDLRDGTKTCRLNSLSVSDNKTSQVGVTWFCLAPLNRMYGDVFVKNGSVQKVAYGRQPMIVATPISPGGAR